eukprot:3909219-Prymnesium_polylepis.1
MLCGALVVRLHRLAGQSRVGPFRVCPCARPPGSIVLAASGVAAVARGPLHLQQQSRVRLTRGDAASLARAHVPFVPQKYYRPRSLSDLPRAWLGCGTD